MIKCQKFYNLIVVNLKQKLEFLPIDWPERPESEYLVKANQF